MRPITNKLRAHDAFERLRVMASDGDVVRLVREAVERLLAEK